MLYNLILKINLGFLVLSYLNYPIFASDHIDGAATIEDGQADLTDLYVFATPNKKDNLTLILNMYPGVTPVGHFSSKVSYDVFIRLAEQNAPPLKVGFKTYFMDELNINCKFTDPSHHKSHSHSNQVSDEVTDGSEFTCSLSKENIKINSLSGQIGVITENQIMRIFAGPRTDAFFISASTFMDVTNRKKFNSSVFGSGSNAMDTINVMSIAIELDLKSIGIQSDMLAIGAQSYTDRDGVYEALDRIGRPEITNLSLHDFSGNSPIKRDFNKLSPFEITSIMSPKYKQRLIDNIAGYDSLDGNLNFKAQDLEELADVLVDDFLVINLMDSCFDKGNQYLNLEKEMFLGLELKSCGGRKLTDDIMATLYSIYIQGYQSDLSNFETGVSMPYQANQSKTIKSSFPYLDIAGDTSWTQWFLFNAAKSLQE